MVHIEELWKAINKFQLSQREAQRNLSTFERDMGKAILEFREFCINNNLAIDFTQR